MTYYAQVCTTMATPYGAAEHEAYLKAVSDAHTRARHSYFDQHIVRMDDGSYWIADEGAYETLIQDLVDRIVHTVDAGRSDEW